jgi:dTDP-4-amino-4,6-dideoxygalactose transaminase
MIKFLDLKKQNELVKEDLSREINNVMESAYFIGHPIIAEFEKNFAKFLGVKFCVGVGNGTDALEIAIESLNLPKGSEIIVPANSFIATSEAVVRLGHKVIFADVELNTASICPESIISKITKDTRAIIVVHLWGQPSNMDKIKEICQINKLKLIEDCAQSHGAKFNDNCVGTFGDVSAFSFYPGKNLGAFGDAGAVVTNDKEIYKYSKMVSNHGRVEKYFHEFPGRNSRLDGIHAAVLNVKLKNLKSWLKRRNQIAALYRNEIANPDILLFDSLPNCYHSYHLFVIRVPDRDKLSSYFDKHNIEYGVHYPVPLHLQPAHQGTNIEGDMPNAESLSEQIISLPIGEHLDDFEVRQVIEVINACNFN